MITIGNNLAPPEVCKETCQKIYEHVRSDEFNVAEFNALLLAVVTYLDKHNVEYADKALPCAESCGE